MAPRKNTAVAEQTPDVSGSNIPEDEWETTQEESPTRVVFDTPGDIFVGRYEGTLHIAPEGKDEFDVFTFRGENGERYAINTSYRLLEAMEDVQPGQWVRLTYVKDIETRRGLNPLKDFRVQVRKSS